MNLNEELIYANADDTDTDITYSGGQPVRSLGHDGDTLTEVDGGLVLVAMLVCAGSGFFMGLVVSWVLWG